MGLVERVTGQIFYILGQITVPLAFIGALLWFTCCLTVIHCDFRCAEMMFKARFAGTHQQVLHRKGDYSQQDAAKNKNKNMPA